MKTRVWIVLGALVACVAAWLIIGTPAVSKTTLITSAMLLPALGASIGGRLAKVMYGSVVIAGLGEWSMSGFVPDVADDTAFGSTVKKWKRAGIDDAGEIAFTGMYDPADTNGQVALNALQTVTSGLTNLYLYESTSVFWRVGTGGEIVLTKFNAIKFSKSGLATVEFAGKVSGAAMERVA